MRKRAPVAPNVKGPVVAEDDMMADEPMMSDQPQSSEAEPEVIQHSKSRKIQTSKIHISKIDYYLFNRTNFIITCTYQHLKDLHFQFILRFFRMRACSTRFVVCLAQSTPLKSRLDLALTRPAHVLTWRVITGTNSMVRYPIFTVGILCCRYLIESKSFPYFILDLHLVHFWPFFKES